MIVEIEKLNIKEIQYILSSAIDEGYNHIKRLIDDYQSNRNCFNALGEKLIGYKIDDLFVAICGLNVEQGNNSFARIRRLYVLPTYRNQGIGSKLVEHLINHAVDYFTGVTVNLGNLPVENFYYRLGFKKTKADYNYSHFYKFGI